MLSLLKKLFSSKSTEQEAVAPYKIEAPVVEEVKETKPAKIKAEKKPAAKKVKAEKKPAATKKPRAPKKTV